MLIWQRDGMAAKRSSHVASTRMVGRVDEDLLERVRAKRHAMFNQGTLPDGARYTAEEHDAQ